MSPSKSPLGVSLFLLDVFTSAPLAKKKRSKTPPNCDEIRTMLSATWNCQDFKRFSTKVHTKIDYIYIYIYTYIETLETFQDSVDHTHQVPLMPLIFFKFPTVGSRTHWERWGLPQAVGACGGCLFWWWIHTNLVVSIYLYLYIISQ